MDEKIFTFFLPDIGEGVVEGEVVEWLKKVGDSVAKDEPVVVVMTDKATVELPSPYSGKLQKIYYQPGQMALKDKPLYDIILEDSSILNVEEKEKPKTEQKRKITEPRATSVAISKSSLEKPKAIPKIRHLAKEWNMDLTQISGTGPNGRITEADLHQTQSLKQTLSSQVYLEGDEIKPLIGIRGLMAKKMHETRIPQFSYFEQIEVSRLIHLRQNIKVKANQEGINLSFMPFFIRALSLTIIEFPQINASLDMQSAKIIFHKQQHVGIAMAFFQGLIVPVLKNVEAMSLTEIIKTYNELKNKAINNKLVSQDMKGASITISNFGVLGEGMWATPMISDSEVAILAIAKIRKTPIVKDEEIVVSDILPLSWSFDHRLIDGELASKISHHYCSLLKNPAALL